MKISKKEKLEKINAEIAKIQSQMREIGEGAHDEWADGGDGWHDERWRSMRIRWQVYEAHLKTLKQEKLKLLRGKT